MGTEEASYLMMKGGKEPGGRTRRMVWTMAVTWATASSIFDVRLEVDLDDGDALVGLGLLSARCR